MFLKVSGISKKNADDFGLHDITFTQKRFQKVVIAGETGSGKSTLLKIIAGLVHPDSGEVILNGEKITGPAEKLVPGHPSICYLSQHFELPHALRVEQVLRYANVLDEEEAGIVCEICRISHLLSRRTDQLSGGEKQRIALARLLVTAPDLLLLDEPFSHLDMVHKNILKSVVNEISSRLKITCLLVSHDPQDTLPWADQIFVLKDGRLIQKGSSEKIYFCPADEYVAGLFGKYNLIDTYHAEAFTGKASKKKAIVRPEQFSIESKKGKGLKGEVMKVNFLGSDYELEISTGEEKWIARTKKRFVSGDQVYLRLSPDSLRVTKVKNWDLL